MLLTLSLRIYNNATYSQFPNSRGRQTPILAKFTTHFISIYPFPHFLIFHEKSSPPILFADPPILRK